MHKAPDVALPFHIGTVDEVVPAECSLQLNELGPRWNSVQYKVGRSPPVLFGSGSPAQLPGGCCMQIRTAAMPPLEGDSDSTPNAQGRSHPS